MIPTGRPDHTSPLNEHRVGDVLQSGFELVVWLSLRRAPRPSGRCATDGSKPRGSRPDGPTVSVKMSPSRRVAGLTRRSKTGSKTDRARAGVHDIGQPYCLEQPLVLIDPQKGPQLGDAGSATGLCRNIAQSLPRLGSIRRTAISNTSSGDSALSRNPSPSVVGVIGMSVAVISSQQQRQDEN